MRFKEWICDWMGVLQVEYSWVGDFVGSIIKVDGIVNFEIERGEENIPDRLELDGTGNAWT